MTMSNKGMIAVAIMVLSLNVCVTAHGQGNRNLIENPGFEAGEKGWKFYERAGGRSGFVLVPEGRTGKYAAKLTMRPPVRGVNGAIEQYKVLKGFGGKRYRFSCWLKSPETVHYQVAGVYELPSKTWHWIKPAEWRDGWARHSVVFDSRPGTTAIAIDYYIRHAGTLLIDDSELVEHEGPLGQTSRPAEPKPGAKVSPPKAKREAPTLTVPVRDAGWKKVTAFFGNHPNAIDFKKDGDLLLFANRQVGLEFQQTQQGFHVNRLYAIAHDQDHLIADPQMNLPNLIQIVMDTDPALKRMGKSGGLVVNTFCATSTDARVTNAPGQATLHLVWKGIALKDEKAKMNMEVTVTLEAGDPFARWRFDLKNESIRYGFKLVYFPVLNLAPISEKTRNVFIYPRDRGRLVEDVFNAEPGGHEGFHRGGRYPAAYGMQFQALYNKRTEVGLFLGTQDPKPNLKNTESYNHPTHIAWKPGHWPPNRGFAKQDYKLDFDCVTRSFKGDWWDACRIYRQWALKQTWCRKGPLATRTDIPKWYKEAPLYLVTSYWGGDGKIAACVEHMLQYLRWARLPLPCNVYGWKKPYFQLTAYEMPHSYWRSKYRFSSDICTNAHDGNYPKLAALPSFSAACKRLKKAGGMMCPYVCLQIYDQGPVQNAPYAKEAFPYVVRDLQGELQTYGREPSWAMCPWSQWWRDRMKETCLELYRREHAGGFYLDTMSGTGEHCYWTPHGHTAAGGVAGPAGMHGLCERVFNAVKAEDPNLITSGEDSAENMIDVIDSKLYQYTLTPTCVAPLFAAVYQDYILRYGMRLTTLDGEGFYMGAGSLFVEGAQVGRIRVNPHHGGIQFDDPSHREMRDFLGRIVAYYRQDAARKFLSYGQLMRPLVFQKPAPMPMVTAKVGRWSHGDRPPVLPALLSGVFRARDGEIGIFVVNISKQELSFASQVKLARHGLSDKATGRVEVISPQGKPDNAGGFSRGVLNLAATLPARHVTLYRLVPTAR